MSNNNFSIGLGKKKNMLNRDINFKFKYPSYLKIYQKFKTKNQNHLINIFNNLSINNNNNNYNKKKSNSFSSIPIHLLLSNLLYKKYQISPSTYNKYLIQQLIDKKNTHLYITYKEMKILNKNNEFFKRYYNIKEINDRIPKYYLYYKNYLTFFCRPQINEFFSNKILMKHMEKEAEVFYKENYADEDTEILEKKEKAKQNKNKYENIFNKNVINDIENEAKKIQNDENKQLSKKISLNKINVNDLNINNFDDISKINTILTNSNLQSITNTTNNRLNTNNNDNSCINIIVKLLTGRKEKNNNKKSSKSQKVSNANSKIEICLDSNNNFNSNSKIKSVKHSKKNSKMNSNINSNENNNSKNNNNNNIINNNINNIYNYHTHNHISKINVKKIIYSPKINNNNNILYKKPIDHKLILNSINEFNNPFVLNYSLSNKNIKFKNMYNTNLNSPKLNSKFNFYQSKSKVNIYSTNNNNIKNLENILKNLPYNNISHHNKNIKLSKNPKLPVSNISLLINSPIQLYSTQSKKIRSNSNIMGREKSPYSTTFLSRNSSDFSPRITKGRNHFSSYKNNLHRKKNSVRFEESTGTNSRNYISNIPLIRINSGILNVKNKFGIKKYGKLNHNIVNFIKSNKVGKKNINKKNNLSSK